MSTRAKERIDFEPICNPVLGSWATLTIRPPGTWFDSPYFHAFVGGCGCGKSKTLERAKKLLLESAIARCDQRIAAAKAEAEHYERERDLLVTRGLRRVRR